ncbi:MAG: hypothetical protein ACRDRP_16035, partial [Pseudonocardiaceae bacterium]
MATSAEITNAAQDVQDKVLDHICVVQHAVVGCVRSWAETVEMVFSKLPDYPFAGYPLHSGHVVERAFGFTERMMASQREFAAQVFEAALPAAKAAQEATAQTTAQTVNSEKAKAASAK